MFAPAILRLPSDQSCLSAFFFSSNNSYRKSLRCQTSCRVELHHELNLRLSESVKDVRLPEKHRGIKIDTKALWCDENEIRLIIIIISHNTDQEITFVSLAKFTPQAQTFRGQRHLHVFMTQLLSLGRLHQLIRDKATKLSSLRSTLWSIRTGESKRLTHPHPEVIEIKP